MDDAPTLAAKVERVSIRRPLGHGGLETLAAHYVGQTFKPHSHPEYLIGVITGGVHSVWCRGEYHAAVPGTVVSMRPGDVHHGDAAVEAGWVQRMFYIGEDTMAEILANRNDAAARPDFSACNRHDAGLAATLERIHGMVHASRLTLSRDAALVALADVVAAISSSPSGNDPGCALPDHRASMLVDYLHARVADDVSLDVLASLAGLRRRQTIDVFRRRTGLPPHAYHIGLKVRLVQDRLRAGHSPAMAAMEAGFADQSHMTRHFTAIVGMTPAAYAQSDQDRAFVL